MGSEGDNDIPGSGAVFTFGASFFADNLPSHFFIRSDPIIDLACGDEHTMVICQNGRLFGFGSNEYGQIGLGHKNNIVKPSCVKSLKPDKVKLIACGKYHTLAYTETGKLYSWGANHDGQLGLGDGVDSEVECTPSLVDCGVLCATDIVQLDAGASHSIALTYDGNVYVWGSNIEGQLGLGDGVKKTKSPTLLPVKEIIVQIACGLNHTLLLTGQGSVLVFGSGESGKLGLGGKNSVPLPIPVSFDAEPNQVIAISAGGHHSMALTEEGIIYGWGENSSQQLGIPADECKDVNRPTIVTSLSTLNIKHVICGDKHSGFITEKEELYMCGENEHGKLCANDVKTDLPSETTLSRCLPFKISKFDGLKVKQVACGGKQTMVLASPEKVDTTNDHNDNISEVSTHTSVNSNIKNNIINNSLTSNLSPPDNRDIMSPPPKTNSSASLHSLLVPKSNNSQNNPSNKSSHSQIKIPEGCPSPDKLSSLHQNSPNSSLKSNNVQEIQNNVVEITDVISLENSSTSSLSSTQKTDVSMIKNNSNNYSRSLSSNYGKENFSSKNNSNCKSKTRSSKFSSKNSSISYEDEQNRLLCMCINNYKQNAEDISGELKNGENACKKTCQINNFVNNVINNQFTKNSDIIKDYEDKIIELNDHCNMLYSNRIDYINHVHMKELSEIRDCLHMEPCETQWTNDDLNNLEINEEDNDNFNHCRSEKSLNTHNSCNTESSQTHCSEDVSRNHKTNSNKKSNFSDHISCKSGSNYINHCHTKKSFDSSNSNSVESCQTHHTEVASGDHTINSNKRSVFNDHVSNESGSDYQNHCHTKRSHVSNNSNNTESCQTEGASGDHKTDSNKNSDFNDQMSYDSKSNYKSQCHSKKSYDPNKTYDKESYKTHSSDNLSENHQTNSENEHKSNYHSRSESELNYKKHCSKKSSGNDNRYTEACQTHRIDNIFDKQHGNSENKSDSHIHLARESIGRSGRNNNLTEQPNSNDYRIQQSDDEEEHIINYNSKKAHIKQEIKKLEKKFTMPQSNCSCR